MRVYLRLLLAGIRTQSAYPLAMLAGLVANTAFGLLKTGILFAVVDSGGGTVAGYTLGTMSAYVWLSQGMLGSVNMWGGSEIATRIKTGDIAIDFMRPVDVQAAAVVTEVGRGLFALLPRGLPSLVIGALVVGMSLPTTPVQYLLGVASLLIGITVSHATAYLVTTMGFWLTETRGITVLYMALSGLFAGLFTPIWLFPEWLQVLAQATPFPSTMMYPVDVLSGRTTGLDALVLLGVQLCWLAVVWIGGHALTRAGRQKLEVQGG
ncbi:ABC transporter permease [Georgenia alba]|uniref:ABC transporter permease n=1 Tax=Georgenia alba TaxID=2233858 RepID=A0ABW2QAA8_9MICO